MSKFDVDPTVDAIHKMAEHLRHAAAQLDAIADWTESEGNFERVGEAASCVANLLPAMRLDLLVVRPLRALGAN